VGIISSALDLRAGTEGISAFLTKDCRHRNVFRNALNQITLAQPKCTLHMLKSSQLAQSDQRPLVLVLVWFWSWFSLGYGIALDRTLNTTEIIECNILLFLKDREK